MSNGYFISFEGVDGSGKSTQISQLKEYLEESGYDVVLSREPGGTRIGEQIRSVILDPANREMTAVAEALLYAASRAQHVHDVIAPAVKEGKIVICDRFVDSSIAYQQYEAVYRGYESLQEEFSDRIVGIEAARPVEEIFAEIKRYTDMLLKR